MAESTESQSPMVRMWTRLVGLADKVRDVPLLLLRLNMGLLFCLDGWAKLHNLPDITAYFQELHIPAPHAQAVFVSWTQLLCGGLLVVGLASRLAAVPLMGTMAVAILTAKIAQGKIHGVYDLAGTDELTYLLILLAIVVLGPGKLALDRLIEKRVLKKG
jgi:putative oxidoreductase